MSHMRISEKEILKASEQYSYGVVPVRDGVSTVDILHVLQGVKDVKLN